jgi:nitric oxide reductase NorQ protein
MQMTETEYSLNDVDMESGEPTGSKPTVSFGGYEMALHLPKLQDTNHPLVPEVNEDYILREINGRTGLEVVSFAMEDPDFFAMLEGEAGTGKNISIDTICAEANWPRVRVNFSISTSYESLVGRFAPVENDSIEEETYSRAEVIDSVSKRLSQSSTEKSNVEEVAENAIPQAKTFQWVDGLLTKAVKYGWIFVADEINSADADKIMALNGLTEDRNSRYLTIEEKSEIIEPHERFRFVATRNPIDYAGTTDMNSALESRAYVIEFDYHEEPALEEIVRERTNIVENEGENTLHNLVGLVSTIRQQEQAGTDFVTKISTRDLIKIGRLTDIMPIRNAAKTVILGIADPTDRTSLREEIEATNF